jgi:hypothetical protein
LEADDEQGLEGEINKVYQHGYGGFNLEGNHPDIIVDSSGVIQIDLYRRLCSNPNFHPDLVKYSWGRKNLTNFWKREKGR